VCLLSEWTDGDWEVRPGGADYEENITSTGDFSPDDFSSGEGDLQHPELWMFGHYTTEQSFEKSIQDDCVYCNRFAPQRKDYKANPMLARLGWFSLFSVRLDPVSPSVMSVYVLGMSGGFQMIPHIGMYILILNS
jgi:hypothetical protein